MSNILEHSWSIGVFRTFLKQARALKRTLWPSPRPAPLVPPLASAFVPAGSSFLFNSKAGFARATFFFTCGLGPLVFLAPYYSDGF